VDGSVELLHRVTQATVALAAQIPAEHPSAAVLGTARFGTGSVVAPLGLILTVNYVVLGADDVTVMDLAGREHSASLVAQDFLTGIAVLRIEADDIAGLPLGSSQQLACGVDVLTVAAAGRGERRVAAGAVTSLETFDAYWEYRLDRAIWSTCNNPGLAGGCRVTPGGADGAAGVAEFAVNGVDHVRVLRNRQPRGVMLAQNQQAVVVI
jgi:hypothetical protein